MNNFKTVQGRNKMFKDNKMFFKDQGHNQFWCKFKESPWCSRTCGSINSTSKL